MKKKALVVGSGFGGIASALRLRRLGFQVTILEKLDQIGGRARVFKKAGYTFDAGPNACLILPKSVVPEFMGLVKHYFPSDSKDYVQGIPISEKEPSQPFLDDVIMEVQPKNTLRYIISTEIGGGPKVVAGNYVEDPTHLLNADGLPKQ